MSEELLKQLLRQRGWESMVRVQSAGLHAVSGTGAHPWASSACGSVRLSLAAHRSKQVSAEMIDDAEAIFAMDFQNKAELLALFPKAKDKIFMLSAYARGPLQGREILDPYHRDEAYSNECCKLLHDCITSFVGECVPVREATPPSQLATAS
jgi:protein-tyrosine phosphatase